MDLLCLLVAQLPGSRDLASFVDDSNNNSNDRTDCFIPCTCWLFGCLVLALTKMWSLLDTIKYRLNWSLSRYGTQREGDPLE